MKLHRIWESGEFRGHLTVSLLILAIAIPTIIIAANYTQKFLQSTGITKNTELQIYYLDLQPQTSIEWGAVGNGTYYNYSIIENVGNVALNLSMITDENLAWLSFGWNCTNYILQPNAQVISRWELIVSNAPNNTPFSFTVTVTGYEL